MIHLLILKDDIATLARFPILSSAPQNGTVLSLEGCLPIGKSVFPTLRISGQQLKELRLTMQELDQLAKTHPLFTEKSKVKVHRAGRAILTPFLAQELGKSEVPRAVVAYTAQIVEE